MSERERHQNEFSNTRWSMVLRAKSGHTRTSLKALDELCRLYWFPLYHYVRRRGFSATDAEDMVQGFFRSLISRDVITRADPTKGKLRAFLLAALKDHMTDEVRRENALKRGREHEHFSLDMLDAEPRFMAETSGAGTPELEMDRAWAREVLRLASNELCRKWNQRGKQDVASKLSPYLVRSLDAAALEQLASQLNTTSGALKVTLHRMRDDFRNEIRAQVADTVSTEAEIDSEMAYLRDLLRT